MLPVLFYLNLGYLYGINRLLSVIELFYLFLKIKIKIFSTLTIIAHILKKIVVQ